MQTWESIKGIPPAEIPPGVYSGVPFPEYAMLPFLNYSKLKHFQNVTPAHARYELTHETESKEKNFGLALHLAIFEPKRFDAETVVAPKVDRRFKEGKAAWKQYEELAKGRMILDEEQAAALDAIRANCMAHETVHALLTNKGVNEMTFIWNDPEFPQVRCKGRSDRYTHLESWPINVDLKSFGSVASRHAFEKQAHQLGYWLQAAFYSDGLDVVAPTVGEAFRRFLWIVAESKPPHCVRVFEADSEPLEWGRIQYRKAMRTWAEAQRTGEWPGWDQGVELLGLPGWVTRTFAEEG